MTETLNHEFVIKSNFPARISFQVSSRVDSRTIIDQMGAEKLLGRGDLLFLKPGTGSPVRLHNAFINLDEIQDNSEKLIEIGKALNQIDEDGNPIIYQLDASGVNFPEGTVVITDPELIEQQANTTQINIEGETQYIFKPCNDKSEYNRSVKLLDTSGMISLEEATRRSINTVFAQMASELGGEKLASTANRIGIDSEIEHASALIHTLKFGNYLREAAKAKSYLGFTNVRGPANTPVYIPLMDKNDTGRRSHYLTVQFSINDAPAGNELIAALGAATSGRPHHRIGDRYSDLNSLGRTEDNPAGV